MVTLRFSRVGRPHKILFRLVACDSRARRDGRYLEILGSYDPAGKTLEEKLGTFNEERIRYWIAQGAQPSDSVWNFLRKKGIKKTPRKGPKTAAAAS